VDHSSNLCEAVHEGAEERLQGRRGDCRSIPAAEPAYLRAKTQDQLDLQACHRVRSRLVSRRTATINQIRTFLIDQGIAVRTGSRAPRNSLLAILKNRKDEISPRMNGLIAGRYEDWIHSMSGSTRSPARSRRLARRCQPPAPHERSRHWPTDLAAVVAAIGTGGDFSAWLGLVPRQYSIGGRSILGRISLAQRTPDFPTGAPMLTTLLCGLHVPQHIARSQRW
jgi:hypothetical protein